MNKSKPGYTCEKCIPNMTFIGFHDKKEMKNHKKYHNKIHENIKNK